MNEKLNYSEAIEKVSEILERLDKSEIPIDELAEEMETAANLLKECKQTLADTDMRVKNILEELEGDFKQEESS